MSTRLAFVLLAACGGGGGGLPAVSSADPAVPVAVPVTGGVAAPTVTIAGVVSTEEGPPPIVVWIDAQGQRRLAAAASWKDVGIGVWSAGPKAAGGDASRRSILEAAFERTDPKEVVDGFSDYRVGSELPGATDDPPPPPEDEDESGGLGTAMALEEGKVRHQPAQPSVGPWRGPVNVTGRSASVVGDVSNAKPARVPAVVIANPATKAAVVVAAVSDLGAMIGVWSAGHLRPLRIQFHLDRDHTREPAGAWLELELATNVMIDGKPIELGAISPSLDEVRRTRQLGANATIDVLVGPEVDAQKLVDVLVALDRAGVTSIGLGLVPTEEQRKANRLPVVAQGVPNATGDLDKAIIRRYVKQNLTKITYCYEKELLATPNLQGKLTAQFFITPTGKVATSTATGLNAEAARCIAAVIKTIEFPKPKGGGGVQVNYPFTFLPSGAKP